MDDKDTIGAAPSPHAPSADNLDNAAQYSWIHCIQFPIFIEKSQILPLLHQHHGKPEKEGK